ncbi:MAG: MBL fold metallo-hydrolase [Stappia sp.]|uniref:ribonuclease J n=1 Tax=Stappia sp. TaxID=1870903 RepID=UPI000C5DD12A|nr:ribonuclease J [Stappia sp.]MAA98729.1 MBL fold metallo-hydrolase [Stappia sp.]MBM21748.1 MBL fold metallo-hydrolase [Stappia sp.]
MASKKELVFVALGGLGEIGMNMALYGYGTPRNRRWLMVDCGVTFAGPELPGVDVVVPDISFIESQRDRLDGIVITHAHEDHYGAILQLWPRLQAPLYMTPFTAGMLASKAAGEPGAPDVPVNVLAQGSRKQIGAFDVELVAMSHSIPEPCALAIRTEAGTVVHSGDWKMDATPGIGKPIDKARLAEIGEEGVLALVCDSTNAVREGRSPSEADVAGGMIEVIRSARKRVAVTTFASNVARIRSVALAAKACDRDVVVMGRSMHRVIEVATELGYLDGLPPFLGEDAYGYLPPERCLLLLTGSQGEARAALARIASGDHRNVALSKGDTVIFSSRTIPGNEKGVGAIVNQLSDAGVRIVSDKDAMVHVSGHPRRDELVELYGLVKPQTLVPAHGEPLHLKAHHDLGVEQGIPVVVPARNGDMVRLAPGTPDIVETVQVGIEVRDGLITGDPEETGTNERRKLSQVGSVVVTVLVDARGEIVSEPQAALFGLPEASREGDDLEDLVIDEVISALKSIPRNRRKDLDLVAESARRAARAAIRDCWGKKPLTEALVFRV